MQAIVRFWCTVRAIRIKTIAVCKLITTHYQTVSSAMRTQALRTAAADL
jgi:hypothetical protein